MKKVIMAGLSLLLLAGCIPVLIGAGVVTGYVIGGDSAQGNVRSEYRVLWDICVDRLETMESEILLANESKGIIKARISENNVTISINTINPENQRLKVSARKFLLPKPQFAQKVFFKMVEDL